MLSIAKVIPKTGVFWTKQRFFSIHSMHRTASKREKSFVGS